MGPRFGVWLELTSDDSHAALQELADTLCAKFEAKIAEQYPLDFHEGDKEYWTLFMDGEELMLMRLRGSGTALGGQGRKRIQLLIHIASILGIRKRIGWRWHVWEASNTVRRLFCGRHSRVRTD